MTETKIAIRGREVSIRFGQSAEDQAEAETIVGAMREGYIERRDGKVLSTDKDGTPVYRLLIWGFRWVRYDRCAYGAADGPDRSWQVGHDNTNSTVTWGAVLHDDREDSPHIIASHLRTMQEARNACEHAARRMRWVEGASW